MEASTTFAISAFTAFPAVHDSITNIYSTINNILTHRYANMIRIQMDELDVQFSIQSIECFIKGSSECVNSDVTELTVERIHETIRKIHKTLASIEKKLNDYQTNWYVWLRGIHLSDEIQELHQQKTILDKRVDMLTQILIMNAISKKKSH